MNSLTISISLPPKECSPNGRGHWSRRAMANKCYRLEAWAACVKALDGANPPKWLKAQAKIAAYFPTRRRPDPDNLIASLKAAFDGIADAEIVANDRGLWPERPVILTDPETPRIQITITEEPS